MAMRPTRRPPLRPLAALAPAAAALLAAGCGSGPPGMRVVEANLSSHTDDGFVIDFILEGDNPNEEPLPLREVDYWLSLDGEEVFRGRRAAEATLPRKGTQRFRLPVAVSHAEWPAERLSQRSNYTFSAEVTYLTESWLARILFDAGIQRPTVVYTTRGQFGGSDEISVEGPPAPEPAGE